MQTLGFVFADGTRFSSSLSGWIKAACLRLCVRVCVWYKSTFIQAGIKQTFEVLTAFAKIFVEIYLRLINYTSLKFYALIFTIVKHLFFCLETFILLTTSASTFHISPARIYFAFLETLYLYIWCHEVVR